MNGILRVAPLVMLTLSACAPAGEEEEAINAPVYEAATFFQTVSLRGASFSGDESKLLFSSDSSGTFNVYSQSVEGGGERPEAVQLTSSESDSVFGLSYFPQDERFLFSRDSGGNELTHLFVREADGSEKDLTPGDALKAQFAGWSGDKSGFWVQTNERDPQAMDLYRYNATDYERRLAYENTGGYFVGAVSDDERYVALTKLRSNADSNVFLHDFEAGETTLVTPHEGDVSNQAVTFSPDGRTFYYRTDGEGEFAQVWSYDLESEERQVAKAADWDISAFAFSESGKYLVTSANQDAQTVVEVVEVATGEALNLPDLGTGDLVGLQFSPSDSKLAYYLNSDTSPSNLHVLDLSDGEPVRLSNSLSSSIDRAALVESEVVRYPSFDGLEIPSLLYRPVGASADKKMPAMIMVHGGPGGQSRKGYRADVQHLVNQGYVVLAVNNRGSSGYGKTFFHMDDRKHGDVDLKDCVWGRKYLEALDWVDSERIGIMGGSYGGYMVAAALAFESEVFDVGIDIFGVTNWVRTLQSMPPWWGAQRDSLYAELGDPATDLERLTKISPLFHAQKIVRPLLVIQGANDPRVLQAESDELVEAVRANQVPVEYVVFPDEGHGFRKRENRITAADSIADFLAKHLSASGTAPRAVPDSGD